MGGKTCSHPAGNEETYPTIGKPENHRLKLGAGKGIGDISSFPMEGSKDLNFAKDDITFW